MKERGLTMSNECNQKKDADRFRFLQNIPAEQAQAFFWNYQSRYQRAKAIDAAMLAAQELSHD